MDFLSLSFLSLTTGRAFHLALTVLQGPWVVADKNEGVSFGNDLGGAELCANLDVSL